MAILLAVIATLSVSVFRPCDETCGCTLLDIADTGWAADRPDPSVGWCGEVALQMALRYYGIDRSQHEIHAAGHPLHADLYEEDLPVALDAFGIGYERWPLENNDVLQFLEWVRVGVASHLPVVCGVKLLPDKHPDWTVDHFVLAVGICDRGLILNTQPEVAGRVLVPYEQLTAPEGRITFVNRDSTYFGLRILGP